ncbi:MAG: ABC transporter substrate-binding protein [Cardiobacteriaceae bacterium]|nr:ABC transporter substrate-binding protein [Cardiobacteriaceae bacterium]
MKKLFIALLLLNSSLAAYAADKISLVLDWFVNPVHSQIIIAQQKGFFAAQGLEVELSEPTDAATGAKLVAAGKADLSMAYQPQLHQYRDEGLPVVRVSTMIATPLNTLMVLKDSGIKTIADLKGKKIGYSVAGFEDTLLHTLLAEGGLKPEEVETVNVNWSISPSLMSKQVDAVIGGYRNFELHEMDLAGHPGMAFFPEEHGVPAYDEMIIIAQKDKAHDPRFRRFNQALEQATLFMINHPEEAWQSFSSYKKELNDEINHLAFKDTLPRLALRPGASNNNRYQQFSEFLAKNDVIKKAEEGEEITVEP